MTVQQVDLRVLGPVEALFSGRRVTSLRQRERCVLGILLVELGHCVSVERLVDILWGPEPPSSCRSSLQTYVSRLRAAFADADAHNHDVRVQRRGGGYTVEADPSTVDLHRFIRLTDQARATVQAHRRSELLHAALRLWRGQALADVRLGVTGESIRTRLDGLRHSALAQRFEADLATGRGHELLGELSESVARDPTDEHMTGMLMLALNRAGRRSDALRVYVDAREQIVAETGMEPGKELCAIHRSILDDDQEIDVTHLVRGADGVGVGDGKIPGPPVAQQLPPNLNVFTGRAGSLACLDSLLDGAASVPGPVICAVSGTAGVGKTALVVHWAHRVAHRFPDGQIYVDLRGFGPDGQSTSPADALRLILEALGEPARHIPAEQSAVVALYRSLVAGRRVLIVLDNARDAQHVRPLLPGTATAFVLITSRNRLTSLIAAEGARTLMLDLMSTAEATDMLAERLGYHCVAAEPEATERIIAACAGLPLAMAIVAARAQVTGFPLAALAADLGTAAGTLDALETDDAVTGIRTVLSWSYRCLGNQAARLFRLLGLHTGPFLTISAAASLAHRDRSTVKRLLSELTNAHLVSEDAPGRFTLHDLLRAYAAELAYGVEPEDEREQAMSRLLDHYLHSAHAGAGVLKPHRRRIPLTAPRPGTIVEMFDDHAAALAWLTMSRPSLLAAIVQASDSGHDRHAWQLAAALVDFLQRQGHWHDQAASQRIALRSAVRQGDPSGQAFAYRGLARAMLRLGEYADATACLQQALGLSCAAGDLIGQASAHRGLALALGLQGDHNTAKWHAERALDLYLATESRVGQAEALNSRGWCQVQLGDYHGAVNACRQALDLFTRVGDQRDQAETWDTLGFAYHHLADYDQAITCYQHALALFRSSGDRYQEADTLTHLGYAHHLAHAAHAARAAWRQALDILEELHHPDAAELRRKLAQQPDAEEVVRQPTNARQLSRL